MRKEKLIELKSTTPEQRRANSLANLKKGGGKNGFWRAKGSRNKAPAETKLDIQNFLTSPEYQGPAMERIKNGEAPGLEKFFWETYLGKATQPIEVTTTRPSNEALRATLKALSKEDQKAFWDLLTKASKEQADRANAIDTEVKALKA